MVGMISIFKPVIRQVIEPNIHMIKLLPPMANLGESALAIVKAISATVVIMLKEDMSWLWKTGSGGSSANPCPADDSLSSSRAHEIWMLKLILLS